MGVVSPEKGKRGRGGGLCCRVYNDWQSLEAVEGAWDGLAEMCGAGIYASFAWRRTWWEFYGRGSLEIRLVWNGDDLVAVFPFFREIQHLGGLPVSLLRLVGCDHAGPVGAVPVEPGMEDAAVEALAASLADEEFSDWDLVHIGPLSGYAERVKDLADAFERHFAGERVAYRADVRDRVVVNLPQSYEQYLDDLSGQERGSIRKAHRRIRRQHEIRHCVKSREDGFAEALDRFLDSHERFWRSKGSPGWFNEWPDAKAFHKRLAEVLAPGGRCFITELGADGNTIAGIYGFRFGRLVHGFQPARDDSGQWHRYSLGRMAFVNLVEYAVSTGATLIDAGGRPYEYKLRIGGRLVGDSLITISRRGWYSRSKVGLFRVAAWILHTLYSRIWYRRLAPALGLGGRPFRRLWIRSRVVFPAKKAPGKPGETRRSGQERGL
ncbi:MAG: GNAT family N-acetyltransferase [Planctomycetes bacterium]|nr:GNAT family N-acetyltransferase [Planctomycetota bacterium]